MALRCGKYVLGERLAVGGMAEVFLATASGEFGFSRRVVVKRLLPHLADNPQVVRLFLDEARLLSRLHHPRVVQVLDLGSAEGHSYQVLEHLDGLDLAGLLTKAPFAPELALRIGVAIAEGLAHIHGARGDEGEPLEIVHGDVAPGNVMLTRAGEAKLVDFGVARWAGHHDAPRGGTPGFVAPEVLAGAEPSHSSDLYGLGRVLEKLCAGSPVPVLAHALIEALTAQDPQQRPRTADEALAVLNTCLRELGPVKPLAQLLRPHLPDRRRLLRPDKVAATILLTAPVLAFETAVALGSHAVRAPAQLVSYARGGSPVRMALTAAVSGLGLAVIGFGLGLWLGWLAPGQLTRSAAGFIGLPAAVPMQSVQRASDTPSRPSRHAPAPPRRRKSRGRASGR